MKAKKTRGRGKKYAEPTKNMNILVPISKEEECKKLVYEYLEQFMVRDKYLGEK